MPGPDAIQRLPRRGSAAPGAGRSWPSPRSCCAPTSRTCTARALRARSGASLPRTPSRGRCALGMPPASSSTSFPPPGSRSSTGSASATSREAPGRPEPVGLPVMVEPLAMKPGGRRLRAERGRRHGRDPRSPGRRAGRRRRPGKADPTDDLGEYGRVVEAAGRVPVLVGGGRASDEEIMRRTEAVLQQGAADRLRQRRPACGSGRDDARADGDRARGRVRRGGAGGPHRPCLTRSFASGSWVAVSWAGSSPAAARWVHWTPSASGSSWYVCDPNPDALAWYERLDPTPRLVSDYRELLADDSVKAVYCAVLHHLHEEVYVASLRARKHLLGEKLARHRPRRERGDHSGDRRHPELLVRCSSELPLYPGASVELDRRSSLWARAEVRSAFLHSSDLDPGKPIN